MDDNQKSTLRVENFALNLYIIRESQGITHEKLAEMLEVSTRIIYDWENGTKRPSIQNAVKISIALGVSLDSIFSDKIL